MIEINNVTKKFDSFIAVNNINLVIPDGQFIGFIGPNGAGKTTMLRMLTSILKPTSGSIKIGGFDTSKQDLEVKKLIGVVESEPSLFGRLRVREHIEFVGSVFSLDKNEMQKHADELLEKFDLASKKESMSGDLSHGMAKKLSLLLALLHNPKYLFLDEPFEAIDPISSKHIKDILIDYTKNGGTVFLTSHILEIVQKLVERIVIINKGKLLFDSPIGEVEDLETKFIELIEKDSKE
jgi:ABC-2 type transport system ATP-binding protein